MPKLTIDNSLLEPIEIEINGTTFKVQKMTRAVLTEVEVLRKEADEDNLDAGYKMIELLLGEDCSEIIQELDIRQVTEIAEFIKNSISSSEDEEKNVTTPGGETSQQ